MQQLSSPVRRPRPRYRLHAFYITILIISVFAVLSSLGHSYGRLGQGAFGVVQKRTLDESDRGRAIKADIECRLVHQAEDQCAFIQRNCPDEQAGLLDYLSLYYCSLGNAQPAAFVVITIWLALLFTTIGIAASDFFCINLSTIASKLGMSESLAGVTLLAFGNGSPDVFSTFAAMSSNSGSLAVGELIGAAGFITAVVAGSMALVREFKVGKKTFVRDVGCFVVAASFSMVFLADGHLYLWECFTMVAFYISYVIVVVVWHWHLGRRRRQRERDAAARGQYLSVTNEEMEVTEEDDEETSAGVRSYPNIEDFRNLERGGSPGSEADDSDSDGEQGKQLATEMASSMRVTRPKGNRRNTITPIRPSLVGALEFRSVLASLQKSRGSSARPIYLRRYSDDPRTSLDQSQSHGSTRSYRSRSALSSDYGGSQVVTQNPARYHDEVGDLSGVRAVSLDHALPLERINPVAYTVAEIPNIGIVAATPTFPRDTDVSHSGSAAGPSPTSPTFSLSPPPSAQVSRDPSPAPAKYEDRLAPPSGYFPGVRRSRFTEALDEVEVPRAYSLRLEIPVVTNGPRPQTPSPILPFPAYSDSPLLMSAQSSRAPSIRFPEQSSLSDAESQYQEKPIKWWPYNYLPSPYTLASTLFPTLCTWRDKSIWDKFVSVVSAPSIFLLAITLPVVESEFHEEAEEEPSPTERLRRPTLKTSRSRSGTGPLLVSDSPDGVEEEPEWLRYRRSVADEEQGHPRGHTRGFSGHSTAAIAISVEEHQHNPHSTPSVLKISPLEQALPGLGPDLPHDWNRWLVSLQVFTAPLFVVLIIWANTEERDLHRLIRMILYSLVGSLLAFALLLAVTSSSKPPKYRHLLCFLGFVVSISWISTIANEVVGVLKAFGVILGISDAILGLTVFAVGNSLGDLVADVTVARLGYPVMALSACFGGPMLNILLGIGISGAYMTLQDSSKSHLKHPHKKIKYKPYQVEVSGTLMVSAITLIVTLLGLLIVVPMSNWMMTRKIGWGLIILWSFSTVVNLGVELSGGFGPLKNVAR